MTIKTTIKIDPEHKDRIKEIVSGIEHYKQTLNKPPFKLIFEKEDSHNVANRMIKNYNIELDAIITLYK